MQFSQRQLRDTLGISVETFRHWKRVLPPFAERKRYTPRFSIGDLLAASILHRLTEQCGIRVGVLPEISQAVVEICNGNSWAALESKTLFVDVTQHTCRVVKNPGDFSAHDVVVVCPVGPIIARLRETLSRAQPSIAQQPLRFLPTALGDMRARRRRA